MFRFEKVRNQFGQTIWAVLTKDKSDGINHDLYQVQNVGDNRFKASRITDDGKYVGGKNISIKELRQRALANPPTSYFDTPEEIIAEALTCLRLGGESASEMIKNSPEAYAKAQELDQDEIDLVYRPDQNHPFGWMRASNGYLVEKTPQNLWLRQQAEFRARGIYPELVQPQNVAEQCPNQQLLIAPTEIKRHNRPGIFRRWK